MKYQYGYCSQCVCDDCLLWWSRRCPYGGCFDDHRAKAEPWPGPVRTTWTNWNEPSEQAHWCRGGAFFPTGHCEHYIYYEKDRAVVRACLESNVVVYQDGYIQCSLIDVVGCEACYRRFEEKEERE